MRKLGHRSGNRQRANSPSPTILALLGFVSTVVLAIVSFILTFAVLFFSVIISTAIAGGHFLG